MPSAIDPSVIGAGNVDKASMRVQLERARDEITALQAIVAGSNVRGNDDLIINGDFSVWQYGTTSSAAGYNTADCWPSALSGGTVTTSQQAVALGTAFGNNNPKFHIRQAVSGQSLNTHLAQLYQCIEDVRSYAGQTITILGWAYRSAGTGDMAVELSQVFGTGGSPSSRVDGIGVTKVTLTGTWAPFAVTVNVPTVSGKTLGSNNDDYLAVNFWFSAGSTFNARTATLGLQTITGNLWGVHIRRGTWTAADAAVYLPVDSGTQLRRCQRYCCIINVLEQAPAIGFTYSTYPFPVEMRAQPSLTVVTAGVATNAFVLTEGSISVRASYVQTQYTAANGTVTGRVTRYTANL